MKLFLFGQIGSGKSYVGQLLNRQFGLHFHDADDDLPATIRVAVTNQQPITEQMRDEYVDIIISRIARLSEAQKDFCVAQALFKNRHREKLLLAVPDLSFIWVRSTPTLILRRLKERTGHLASAYYGEIVNPGFESPAVPHDSIENAEDDVILEMRRAELVARIRPNQSLEPMARSVTPRAGARVAPALTMAHH